MDAVFQSAFESAKLWLANGNTLTEDDLVTLKKMTPAWYSIETLLKGCSNARSVAKARRENHNR